MQIIKKRSELKVGDVIKNRGIIMKLDLEGKSKFWGGKQNMSYYSFNDAYYGPGSCEIIDDEFVIVTDRKEIRKAYDFIDGELAKYIADSMEYRKKFHRIRGDFWDEYWKDKRKETRDAKRIVA